MHWNAVGSALADLVMGGCSRVIATVAGSCKRVFLREAAKRGHCTDAAIKDAIERHRKLSS